MGQEEDLVKRLRELELELEKSRLRLEDTEALASVGSWEWDMNAVRHRSVTWSKELLRTYGLTAGSRPPKTRELVERVHPEDREEYEELLERVRSSPGPFVISYRMVDDDGAIRHLQARGEVEADADGKPIRVFGATQDITELKESQAQLERARRLEAVGQLAGGVAHDFNNLLSVILNYAEYMIAISEDPETLKGLREIERAAGSAADLTRQLLLFSRRDPFESGPIDLAEVISDTEGMLRRTIGEHIRLEFDTPAGLPSVGIGAGQAQQVLVNLAVNARDALPQGGTIEIGVRELDAAEASALPGLAAMPHLLLTVSDDGIGMSKEVAGHAFDPFFTTKPRGQGTGLGLATVFGIVNQAGGQVEIESEPRLGTTVKVYIPGDDRDQVEPELGPPPPAAVAGRRVLVVENEKAVQMIVCSMLERHGYETRTADGGAEAEEIMGADGAGADLLLTDVLMPGMSGRELVKRLRARNPALRAIYMSGYAGDATSPWGGPWDDGVTILQKPFTEAQLLNAVGDQLAAG